jgi:ketosteroid isomerase-like protein
VSQENVEIVRRMIRAFEDRDAEALVECCSPKCEFLLPRNLLEGGSYRGHEGVGRMLADAYATWEAFRIDVQDVRTTGNCVVVLSHTTNVGKGSAPAITYRYAYLARMLDGKIVYFRPYQSHAEALEAVGLSE